MERFMCQCKIQSNGFAIILNGYKLQVYLKKVINVYLSNLKTENYKIGNTLYFRN